MTPDAQTQSDIQALLEKYTVDYRNHDLEGIMEDWAPDAEVVLYGTGADEKRVGWQAIRDQFARNFAEAEELAFEWQWTAIKATGQVAWLAADALVRATVNGKISEFPIRFTAIFEQINGRWYWVQRHSSAPAAGQASGIAYPD